jgi:hypothetical protein
MQLVADIRHFSEADDRAVAGRGRVHIDDCDRVRLVGRAAEGGDVGKLLRRRSGCITRRAIERRIDVMLAVVVLVLI